MLAVGKIPFWHPLEFVSFNEMFSFYLSVGNSNSLRLKKQIFLMGTGIFPLLFPPWYYF